MSGKKNKAMRKAVRAELGNQVPLLFGVMCSMGIKHRAVLAWKLLIGMKATKGVDE